MYLQMMRQLLLNEGDFAQIQYYNLPMATYARFKPQSSDFLNISNPRAVYVYPLLYLPICDGNML